MACRTFKPLPLFMADANNSGSKSHLKQSRNSQAPIQYCLSMIPSNRGVMLFKLSCSTTRICSSPPPSFSLLKEGIPSLAQCLSSSHPVTDDDDKSKVNFEAQEEEEEKDSVRVKFVAEPPLGNALVQVFCEYEGPDLDCPWSTCSGYRRSNGFIIEGRRLLTCAHCIEHHTNVTIRKQDSNTIYQATVIAIAHDFDLAMLTVRDDEFWEGVGSVELGDMPSPRDELTSMSYVEGMNTITSKSGFISDVAMIPFSHGGLELPAFGVIYDSKFGESGSAIINENGKCVGMGFKGTINIHQGWVLPVTIIKHFIQDYDRNGGFTGLPIFGVEWQTMENYDLRMNMMVGDDHEGIKLHTSHPPKTLQWREPRALYCPYLLVTTLIARCRGLGIFQVLCATLRCSLALLVMLSQHATQVHLTFSDCVHLTFSDPQWQEPRALGYYFLSNAMLPKSTSQMMWQWAH